MLSQPQTFPCPNCNEIINDSMQTCRFCSAPVDPQAASAAAENQSRVNRACSDASFLRTAAAAMFGGSTEAEEVKFTTLTSFQLARMLEKKDFFFVNVHTPYEGEIRNTDAFIVFDKIADNLDKLPKDRTAKIILYCRSGRMSEIAARELTQLGFSQVSHLSGGMIDWKKSGYEILEK